MKPEFVIVKKMIIVVLIVREKNFFQATIVLRANIPNLLSHSAIIIPVKLVKYCIRLRQNGFGNVRYATVNMKIPLPIE